MKTLSDASSVTLKLKLLWLGYQTPKFQENRTGRNPTNWLQSWPDVLHLKIWAAWG